MGPCACLHRPWLPLHYRSDTAFCDSSGCSPLHAILSTNEKDLDNDFCWAGHPVCLSHKVARTMCFTFNSQEEVVSGAKELITLQQSVLGVRVKHQNASVHFVSLITHFPVILYYFDIYSVDTTCCSISGQGYFCKLHRHSVVIPKE